MDTVDFEKYLRNLCEELTFIARDRGFTSSPDFENFLRKRVNSDPTFSDLNLNDNPPDQAFPDICVGEFGIEAKFTTSNNWRCVANSISQNQINPYVTSIYVVYCKMGGVPEVKFRLYDDAVMHVRTSHVPRFEIDINAEESLFTKIGISYKDFSKLQMPEKMRFIRKYARDRLAAGENIYFWWLDDE